MTETEKIPGIQYISGESLQSPERPLKKLVRRVVISGPSYTGKSETARMLAEKYGVEVVDTHGGFERRTDIEKGEMKKSPEKHRRFDEYQAKKFRTTTLEDADIWETRLGGIILAEERDRREYLIRKRRAQILFAKQEGREEPPKLDKIPVISILLWADQDTRVQRAYIDEVIDAEENGTKPPTKKAVKEQVQQREARNKKDWAPNHPFYIQKDKNPYDRKLKRPQPTEKSVYDIIINNSNLTREETLEQIDIALERFDAFEHLTIQEVESIEVFDSSKNGNNKKPKEHWGGKSSKRKIKARARAKSSSTV